MKIRKFEAATMREALAVVKQELGSEAMVLATRQVRHGLFGTGVEVTAAIDPSEPAVAEAPSSEGRAMASLSESDVERIMAPLRSELRSLRSLLRPVLQASPVEELREELQGLRHALLSAPRAEEGEPGLDELYRTGGLSAPSDGRLVALVGPTGVGKTTTIAKLAARSALLERRSVAIVTLDTYRVGGEEQMRAFADLIGVPLTVIAEPEAVAPVLGSLERYDRVYIDTSGRSPRDPDAIGTLERALAGLPDLEVHLALPAASARATTAQCLRRYRALGVDRLLFTKLDEADELAELVRAPARHGRPVSFLTTGQRVPEDLEDASARRLLDLALAGFGTRGADAGLAASPEVAA
jgi:flagellar biosynthesis protein FlhF